MVAAGLWRFGCRWSWRIRESPRFAYGLPSGRYGSTGTGEDADYDGNGPFVVTISSVSVSISGKAVVEERGKRLDRRPVVNCVTVGGERSGIGGYFFESSLRAVVVIVRGVAVGRGTCFG